MDNEGTVRDAFITERTRQAEAGDAGLTVAPQDDGFGAIHGWVDIDALVMTVQGATIQGTLASGPRRPPRPAGRDRRAPPDIGGTDIAGDRRRPDQCYISHDRISPGGSPP